jgi:polygalacturonase
MMRFKINPYLMNDCLCYALLLAILWSACAPADQAQGAFTASQAAATAQAAWAGLPARLARIEAPEFADTTFAITDFGAQADTAFDSRPAIVAAMVQAAEAGGGRVVIPAGTFQCNGPIHLQSGVALELTEGAVLRFSDRPADYLPAVKVRWEGTVCWNWSPLIYAYQQENIGIIGQGLIEGNGKQWSMDWRKRQKPEKKRLREMGNDVIPDEQRVFAHGFLDRDGDGQDDGYGDGQIHYLRPGLILLYDCQNILLEGFTAQNSPFWTIHLPFCRNITARKLKIYGEVLNDDGLDPDSSEDLLIEDCYIETHDDAIAIKAGRDQDAWERGPSRNIIIRNCVLNSGVNAFAVGSEMSGGVRDVFIENCQLKAGQHALNFKTNLDRGGTVENIFIRNIEADSLEKALFIFRMDYHGYRGNQYPTQFKDFYVSDLRCDYVGGNALQIVGVEAQPIERIWLQDIQVTQARTPAVIEHASEIVYDNIQINQQAWEWDSSSK